jgi:RNA polymerase-binding transcription factor DksA
VRTQKNKSARPAAKTAIRPAKKASPKPVERPPVKTLTKRAAPARFSEKRTPKGRDERPSKRPVAAARNNTPAAVPSAIAQLQAVNGKPRKNQAGFSSRELERFRELLLAKRRELIGDMSSMEREALRIGAGSNLSNLPIHMADMGTDNYEQEFTLGLVQKERDLLKEINLALGKINIGTYGLCEGTGQPILKERLEYQPWARYSVGHQRKMERHGR